MRQLDGDQPAADGRRDDLVVKQSTDLAAAMRRVAERDLGVEVPGWAQRNEVDAMGGAVQVFKDNLVRLNRTSLLWGTAYTDLGLCRREPSRGLPW